MNKTLSFTQQLLAMGRNLQALGQDRAAARLLRRLGSFRDLPNDLAEETHLRLADIYLDEGQYKQARRQLTAALALRPDNAHAHCLMAEAALEADGRNPRRALQHYRHCTRLEPGNANYWCQLGDTALAEGDPAHGLAALRRAARLAPDDPKVLKYVVHGLRYVGITDEAKRLLKAALFRNPRDKRFHDLWAEHQFEVLQEAQATLDQRWKVTNQNRPMLLPFVRLVKEEVRPAAATKRIRHDQPSTTPGPKGPLHRQPRKKKA